MSFPPVALPKSGLTDAQLFDYIVATMYSIVPQASPEEIDDGLGDDVRFWSPANIGAYLTGHGVTPAMLADAIAARFTQAAADGEAGWVSGPAVSMSGVSQVDMSGIPADANEVFVTWQGLSTSAQVNVAMLMLTAAGALVSGNYNGFASSLTPSATSGQAWVNVAYSTVIISAAAASFFSGHARLVRQGMSGVWQIEMYSSEGTRQCISSGIKDSVLDFGGIRLAVSGATFDAGSCRVMWRK